MKVGEKGIEWPESLPNNDSCIDYRYHISMSEKITERIQTMEVDSLIWSEPEEATEQPS